MGIKGIGEIAIVALPPRLPNAIFNATGRGASGQLPITPDKLL